MTIADVHVSIGKTHSVCQDYGIADDCGQSDLSGHRAVAVICDGCSSSPDTDWGARFLARAAMSTFDPFNPLTVIQRADSYRKTMELHPQSLDATMLRVKETPEGDADVIVCGDGVVVARRRDGSGYEHWVLSFNNNAPEYLSYLLDEERKAVYQDALCGHLSIDGSEAYNEPAHPDGIHFRKTFSRKDFDVVLIMTDGAESFQRHNGTQIVPVPLQEVLDQVVDIKVLTHGFLRRRMSKFLGKFCSDNGWRHHDDFAVAGLVLETTQESL